VQLQKNPKQPPVSPKAGLSPFHRRPAVFNGSLAAGRVRSSRSNAAAPFYDGHVSSRDVPSKKTSAEIVKQFKQFTVAGRINR
jgi:hypothetical protein